MLGFLVLSNLYRIGQYFQLGFLSKFIPIALVFRLKTRISKPVLIILALYLNLYIFSLPFTSFSEGLYEVVKSHIYIVISLLFYDRLTKDKFRRLFLFAAAFGATFVVLDIFGVNIYASYPEETQLFTKYRAVGNYLNPNAFGLLIILVILMYDDSLRVKPIILLLASIGLLTFSKWYFGALCLIVLRRPIRLVLVSIIGFMGVLFLPNTPNTFSGIVRITSLFDGSSSMNDITTNRSELLTSALSEDFSIYGRGLLYASNDFGYGEGTHNMFALNLLNGGYICFIFYCVLWIFIGFHLLKKGLVLPLILLFSLNLVSHNLLDSVVFVLGLMYFLKND